MTERGFSLSEVLIALLLMTSISLALLKQQWQMHRLREHIKQQDQHWLDLNNAREREAPDKTWFQHGLSLIECMIALTLSLSIITVLMQEYVQIRQQFHLAGLAIDHSARIQYVLDLIRRRGHQAGFTPCLPLSRLVSLDHRTGHVLPTLIFDSVPVSKISLYRMQEAFVRIEHIDHQHQLYTPEKLILHPKSPIIIADCQHAEVVADYRILSAHHQTIIECSKELTFKYHAPIYLGEWVEESFGLHSSRQRQSGLFYQYHEHREELMPDVTRLHGQLERHHGQSVLHLELGTTEQRHIPLDIRMHHL